LNTWREQLATKANPPFYMRIFRELRIRKFWKIWTDESGTTLILFCQKATIKFKKKNRSSSMSYHPPSLSRTPSVLLSKFSMTLSINPSAFTS
jgi:hypothetical protein